MDLTELKELIELIAEKGFAEFELEREGLRLRISRFKEPPVPLVQPAKETAATSDNQGPSPAAVSQSAASAESPDTSAPETSLHTITSPIVGTFYRAPSPESAPCVKTGDRVEPDTVVCIIEAMKLMNEIQAEVTGEVAKIYVENGQPVEYGQPLFGIKV
ncbi:MAG: acetyl-CoA carboxylase biotin carboxyl carrier protein [Blastocatellia bacterium]|nr:acetyl-CoA carboxylase biotin carboxyl carrier protein [Blastocatellia bacterium]